MPIAPWITCCWPGLSRLWLRGDWSGLIGAVLFTGLVNLTLVASFIWPEIVPPTIRSALWLALAGTWLISAGVAYKNLSRTLGESPPKDCQGLFQDAQNEYLRGSWHQAETLLARLLRHDPRDVDARLMLATLYRHTRRAAAAHRELAVLGRLERGAKWSLEIQREKELLAQLPAEEAVSESKSPPAHQALPAPIGAASSNPSALPLQQESQPVKTTPPAEIFPDSQPSDRQEAA